MPADRTPLPGDHHLHAAAQEQGVKEGDTPLPGDHHLHAAAQERGVKEGDPMADMKATATRGSSRVTW